MAKKTPSSPNPAAPSPAAPRPEEGPSHPLFRFYEENKRLVLGGGALLIIIVAVALVVQSTVRAGEDQAWSDLYELRRSVGQPETMQETDELESIRASLEEMKGTDAEPWALYFLACREYQRGEAGQALDHLETIAREFPDHYLMHASFLGTPDKTVPHMINLVKDEVAWESDHPVIKENPDPSSNEQWAIETPMGVIVIELYVTAAPETCAAFRKLASHYSGTVFRTVLGTASITGGEPAQENNPLESIIEAEIPGFPPIEDNRLFHFAGAVSFQAPPLSSKTGSGAFVICVDDAFDLDGAQTVFAKVVDGTTVAEDILEAAKNENKASELAEPVSITAVRLAATEQDSVEGPPQSKG